MLLELPLNVFFKHLFKAALSNSPNCYILHRFSSKNSLSLNHQKTTKDCTSTRNCLQISYRWQGNEQIGFAASFHDRTAEYQIQPAGVWFTGPTESPKHVTSQWKPLSQAMMLHEFKTQLEKFTEKLTRVLKPDHNPLLRGILTPTQTPTERVHHKNITLCLHHSYFPKCFLLPHRS